MIHRVADDIGGQSHRGLWRKNIGTPREILLDDIVLGRSLELGWRDTLPLGHGNVKRQQPGRSGIDGHGGVHLVQGDLVEQGLHIPYVANRHAHLAYFTMGQGMIGVVTGLGGEVEGDGKACLTLREIGPVEFVGCLCR